jgi:membrane carboxypeptidase/penicillin-binding protein PbpC
MLWIDNEDAHFHWHEGTYQKGGHSRCELTGENLAAPLYQQIIDWFREKHEILIKVDPCELNIFYSWVKDCRDGTCRIKYDSPLTTDYYEALKKAIEEAFKLI